MGIETKNMGIAPALRQTHTGGLGAHNLKPSEYTEIGSNQEHGNNDYPLWGLVVFSCLTMPCELGEVV